MLVCFPIWAGNSDGQDIKELMSDLSARTNRRYDMNENACALVKVQYPKDGATFEGTIVGDVEFRNGEYWVYLSKGTKRMRIHLPEVPTIVVEFSDFGIQQTKSNVTYSLEFMFPGNSFESSLYFQAGMIFGSSMGLEVAIGTYLGGFNIELGTTLPHLRSFRARSLPITQEITPIKVYSLGKLKGNGYM